MLFDCMDVKNCPFLAEEFDTFVGLLVVVNAGHFRSTQTLQTTVNKTLFVCSAGASGSAGSR